MRLQTLHSSGVSGGFAVRHVGRYMLAFAQLPGQTRCRFDRFGIIPIHVDVIGERPEDPVDRFGEIEDFAHRVADAFTRGGHLFEEMTTRLRAGPLVTIAGDPAGEIRPPIVEPDDSLLFAAEVGVEPIDPIDEHVDAVRGLQPLDAMHVEVRRERAGLLRQTTETLLEFGFAGVDSADRGFEPDPVPVGGGEPVPAVLDEIRDAKAREHLDNLPFELQTRVPTAEAMKAMSDFSRLTGDYRSLSSVDMQVLALLYDLGAFDI